MDPTALSSIESIFPSWDRYMDMQEDTENHMGTEMHVDTEKHMDIEKHICLGTHMANEVVPSSR